MQKEIRTSRAPKAIGPYSQGVLAGSLLFTSGQLPIDAQTGDMVGATVMEQTKQSLENIKAVLEAGGASLEKVVKTTVFLRNMKDFADMNEVYSRYFKGSVLPSRSAVEVARLPKDALVEIEAIAFI